MIKSAPGAPCGASPQDSDFGSSSGAPHTITYDLEIQLDPEAVGGWENVRHGDAGVSCVVLHDNRTDRFHIYDEHDLEECMAHLNSADVLVSFNGIEFDTPILQSITGSDVLPHQYDILHEVWKALPTRVKGYKLEDICVRLMLGQKNGDGTSATKLYRERRFGRLFDYCLNDVALTCKLVRFINQYGYILTPDHGRLELPRIEV